MFSIEASGEDKLPYVVFNCDTVDVLLSMAVSEIARQGMSSFKSSYRGAMLDLFNWPGSVDPATGRLRILGKVETARAFLQKVFKTLGGGLKPLGSGRQGVRVEVSVENSGRASRLVIVMTKLLATLRSLELHSGQNPFELMGWHELSEAKRELIAASHRGKNSKRFFVGGAGKYLRFPWKKWIPGRTEDIRCLRHVIELLKLHNAPEAILLCVLTQGSCGCRPGETTYLTFAAWQTGTEFGQRIMLRNKGSESADKVALVSRRVVELLERYTDGARRDLDAQGRGMAEFRELARRAEAGDISARSELEATPLFLNSRGRRLTYAVLWHHVSRILRRAGHPATLHWLRHEYVFDQMRRIDLISDPAQNLAMREELAAYMGWSSGIAMLECYDAFNNAQRALEGSMQFVECRDAGVLDNIANPVPWPSTAHVRLGPSADLAAIQKAAT